MKTPFWVLSRQNVLTHGTHSGSLSGWDPTAAGISANPGQASVWDVVVVDIPYEWVSSLAVVDCSTLCGGVLCVVTLRWRLWVWRSGE